MYLLTNIIDSNATSTSTFSASRFRVHECACVIKFHLEKWRLIQDQIFVVVDIISILVDQNFTIKATGIVVESL